MKVLSMLLVGVVTLLSCTPAKHSVKTQDSVQISSETLNSLTKQPNILFIFTDDQSPKTIGAYGNRQIKTPHLDKLAQKGVNFSQAHNMGAWNGAVCQASRTMLNTGRPVWQARKIEPQLNQRENREKTWPKLLEAEGYDTYMTGKWHVAADATKVFAKTNHIRPGMPNDTWDHATMVDTFEAFNAGNTHYKSFEDFMPIGYNRPKSENDNSWSPTDHEFGGFYEGTKHWSEVIKDDAIHFINQAKEKDNPFFMYIAFNAPHDPRQAPEDYQDMYNTDAIDLPVNWAADYPEKEFIGNGPDLRDAALAPFPRTEYATRVHLKEYYAIISHLDSQVGAILKALKNSGKMDNTYIIYTADHGLAVGERGLFGKQNMYEESITAPFIIWGPGIEGGHTIDTYIYLQDAMVSTLELAGIDKPDNTFFHSIIDLAKGTSQKSHYNEIYGAYIDSQRMIKKEGFKLIVYPKANKVKLFDLNKDQHEMNNLADTAENKPKVRAMFADLLKLQNTLGDKLDLTDMYLQLK